MLRRLPYLTLCAVSFILCSGTAKASEPDADDSPLNRSSRRVAIRLHAEVGFVAPLYHRFQLGSNGTYVDLREQLGQDTLFFFGRLSADLDIGRPRRHTISLLYQPLLLRTRAVVAEPLQITDTTIAPGTPLSFRWGFSFWRLSYLYDVLADEREVAFGLGLQLRNARYEYATEDGSFLRSVRNIGPVPLLKFRGRGNVYRRFWMGGEVDGFYAPIRYVNGGRTDVEGAILDASLRLGLAWPHGIDTFLNLRYLFGGAQGTSSDPDAFTDGFTKNWLHFLTVSLGVSLR